MTETLPNPYYHQLDLIADSYTPTLLLVVVLLMGRLWWRYRWSLACVWRTIASIMWVAFVSYGAMALDNTLAIWPKWEMDYSTHTAVAGGLALLGAVLTYCVGLANPGPASGRTAATRTWVGVGLFTLSTAGYFGLMTYQDYHSLQDIGTTFIVTGCLQYWGVTTMLEPMLAVKTKIKAAC